MADNNPLNSESLQETPSNIAPNLDSELDAALNGAFGSQSKQETPVEQPKAQPKEEAQVKEEPKVSKKSDKPVAENKKDLINPNEVPENPPGKASGEAQNGWNTLRTSYKKAKQTLEEKEQEVQRLKQTLAEKGTVTNKEVEELKTQLADLSKYRAMVDVQADPEFMSKYDEPIQKNVNSIKTMLKEMRVSDQIIDQIDFSNTKLMETIISHVADNVDKLSAKRLERRVEEIADLNDKRKEALESHKNNYEEYLENKKKESFSKGAEEEGRMLKYLEQTASMKDKDGNLVYDFLNKITPKENATPAEIAQADLHNKMVDALGKKMQQAFKVSTPEDKADLAMAAVSSLYLKARLGSALNRIKSLEAEIGKISNVSSETEKTKTRTASSRTSNGNDMNLDEALASHFSR